MRRLHRWGTLAITAALALSFFVGDAEAGCRRHRCRRGGCGSGGCYSSGCTTGGCSTGGGYSAPTGNGAAPAAPAAPAPPAPPAPAPTT